MRTATAAPQTDINALLVRVRQLESLLKNSEARCAKLEYKLQDLLRRVFNPKNEKLNPAQRRCLVCPRPVLRPRHSWPQHPRRQPRAGQSAKRAAVAGPSRRTYRCDAK